MSPSGKNLAYQIARSGSAVSLIYGEAQGSASRKDFIHKMNVSLKELRETNICLQLIDKSQFCKSEDQVKKALKECDELISIFVVSIKTARKNS